jgi:hypothetical protein
MVSGDKSHLNIQTYFTNQKALLALAQRTLTKVESIVRFNPYLGYAVLKCRIVWGQYLQRL